MANRRILDLNDSAAYMLTGATILSAFRYEDGEKELIIAGHTEKGDAFILTVSAEYRYNPDRAAFVTCLPTCGADELEKLVVELKQDIDVAEAYLGQANRK